MAESVMNTSIPKKREQCCLFVSFHRRNKKAKAEYQRQVSAPIWLVLVMPKVCSKANCVMYQIKYSVLHIIYSVCGSPYTLVLIQTVCSDCQKLDGGIWVVLLDGAQHHHVSSFKLSDLQPWPLPATTSTGSTAHDPSATAKPPKHPP